MPRRNTLVTLRMVQLESQGYDRAAISAEIGCSLSTVATVLTSSDATRIRKEIESRTIDTVAEVQTDAQAAAPYMFKVLQDIATDEQERASVRIVAAKTVLEMAGHSPVKTVELRRSNPLDADYKNKTEDEIRKEIFEGLDDGSPRSLPAPGTSVH